MTLVLGVACVYIGKLLDKYGGKFLARVVKVWIERNERRRLDSAKRIKEMVENPTFLLVAKMEVIGLRQRFDVLLFTGAIGAVAGFVIGRMGARGVNVPIATDALNASAVSPVVSVVVALAIALGFAFHIEYQVVRKEYEIGRALEIIRDARG
jgi:hypothetical protein